MKKSICFLLCPLLLSLFALTACMSDFDADDPAEVRVTAESLPPTNYSIYQLKVDYKQLMSNNNEYKKINEDLVLEGVVCANDISGNLYQTILLRDINPEAADEAAKDQCLVLAIKNTCLHPYFQLGQRVRVNLNGLYVGVYSKVPKIGQPYKTSSGNWRLGPILFQLCATNVQLVGTPNPKAPELIPLDLTTKDGEAWLRTSDNKTVFNTPLLAKVSGTIDEVDAAKKDIAETGTLETLGGKTYAEPLPKIFGPKALRDAGYGIDRTLSLKSNTSNVAIRTSTQNEISYTVIPEGINTYTGMLTYYNDWQLQLRDVDDIQPGQ